MQLLLFLFSLSSSLCAFLPELFHIHASLPLNTSVGISSEQGILLSNYQNQEVNSQNSQRPGSHTALIRHVAFVSVHLDQFLSLSFWLMAWALGEYRPVILWGVARCGFVCWSSHVWQEHARSSLVSFSEYCLWSPHLVASTWPTWVRGCLPDFSTLKLQFYHL